MIFSVVMVMAMALAMLPAERVLADEQEAVSYVYYEVANDNQLIRAVKESDFNTATAGSYQDMVTFTAEVKDNN